MMGESLYVGIATSLDIIGTTAHNVKRSGQPRIVFTATEWDTTVRIVGTRTVESVPHRGGGRDNSHRVHLINHSSFQLFHLTIIS